ncbi:MAG: XRE family transcriptional regulator [Eubacteriaceae bacterium]
MFGQRLKEIRTREDKKVTQQRLADLLGVDRSSVAKWETSDIVPSLDVIKQIASIFEVSMDYLTGFESNESKVSNVSNAEIIEINHTIKLPVYGRIPADISFEENAYIVDHIKFPDDTIEEGKEYFCFKVDDSSMFPKYMQGDVVIIEKNAAFENVQDYILFVDGSDAVLRRVIEHDDGLLLQPLNKSYESQSYTNESVQLLGIVRVLIRYLNRGC